jgi:hypothetical protein
MLQCIGHREEDTDFQLDLMLDHNMPSRVVLPYRNLLGPNLVTAKENAIDELDPFLRQWVLHSGPCHTGAENRQDANPGHKFSTQHD